MPSYTLHKRTHIERALFNSVMSATDSTACALDKLKFAEKKKMNGINTHVVVDSANCSKQLKFGVDRILSNEICARKTGECDNFDR